MIKLLTWLRGGVTSHYYWVRLNVSMAEWGMYDDISPRHPSLSSIAHSLDSYPLLHSSVPLCRLFLPKPLLFFKICLNHSLPLFFCSSSTLYSELNLYLFSITALLLLCWNCLLGFPSPLSDGPCFFSLYSSLCGTVYGTPQALNGLEILSVLVNALFISPHTRNPELVQTQNSELFFPLTHFRILLAR